MSDVWTERQLARYGDGDVVADYLAEKYHRKRFEVALGLLGAPVDSSRSALLDVGAGSPAFSLAARERGWTPTAVDASEVQRDVFDRAGLPLIVADVADAIPLGDATASALFAGELIEHLLDPAAFLDECSRVLAPGGVLVVTTPNLAELQSRARFLAGRSPRHVDPLHEYLKLHVRPFTPDMLRRVLARSGFRVERLRSNYVVWRRHGRKRWRSRALAQLLPTVGGSLIVRARRA